MKQSYQQLRVWQRAVELVPVVYELVRQLPGHEKFVLADQIRRAAISIPANIAEGQGRQHPREFIQFLAIAKGSLSELHTLLIVAHRIGYFSDSQLASAEDSLSTVRKPLSGLISRLRRQA